MSVQCSFALAKWEVKITLSSLIVTRKGKWVAIGKLPFAVMMVAKLNFFIKATIFSLSVSKFILGIYMFNHLVLSSQKIAINTSIAAILKTLNRRGFLT